MESLPVELLCRVRFETGRPMVPITGGPAGDRVVVEAAGGRFEGPRLSGEVLPPGGDWATLSEGGTLVRVDVRSLWRTDDGADILVTYTGVGNFGETGLELRTAPRFETGDDRYRWLNRIQAVGKGTLSGSTLTYELYELR